MFCKYCIFTLSNNNVIFTDIWKQRVFMFINHYQNIFQLTLKFWPCNWSDRAADEFYICCVCTLSNCLFFFLKIQFQNVFGKSFIQSKHYLEYLFKQKSQNYQNVTHCIFYLWGDKETVCCRCSCNSFTFLHKMQFVCKLYHLLLTSLVRYFRLDWLILRVAKEADPKITINTVLYNTFLNKNSGLHIFYTFFTYHYKKARSDFHEIVFIVWIQT